MTAPQTRSPTTDTKQEQTWSVYIVECADGSLYCGVTTDLERRMQEHNGERPGGARYTRARQPVKLAASCPAPDRAAACRLEHAIRKLPRARKLACLREKAEEKTSMSQGVN